MPRYKLTWSETVIFEGEATARDVIEAIQKWEDWDDEVANNCEETEFVSKGDLKVEEIKST